MRIHLRKRGEQAKLCFSAAHGTNFGKRANPAGTSCGFARCAWIAMQTRYSCVSRPLGRASVMRDTGAASSGRSKRMETQKLSLGVLSRRRRFTVRKNPDEPTEAGDSERQPAGRDT